jgi:xanthine/uracil/vitamin C permease (AzgA family)
VSRPTTESDAPQSAAGKLFDLRVLIGGLFTLYGLVLIVAGVTDGTAELHKASGVHINLWMGIGMLVLGILFLLWWRLNPIRPSR